MTDLAHGLENRVIAHTLGKDQPTSPGKVHDLVDLLGITVRFAPLPPEVAGRTLFLSDGTRVELNPDTTERRAQFTLAHELGHVLVQQWRESSRAPDLVPDDEALEERLCDRIASELLMPIAWARARAAAMEAPFLQGIVDVSNDAEVTLAAAATRMRFLGLPLKTWQLRRSSNADTSWMVTKQAGLRGPNGPTDDLLDRINRMPERTVVPLDPRWCFRSSSAAVRSAAIFVWGSNAFVVAERSPSGTAREAQARWTNAASR